MVCHKHLDGYPAASCPDSCSAGRWCAEHEACSKIGQQDMQSGINAPVSPIIMYLNKYLHTSVRNESAAMPGDDKS